MASTLAVASVSLHWSVDQLVHTHIMVEKHTYASALSAPTSYSWTPYPQQKRH